MAELIPKIMHLPSPNQLIHIVYQRYGEYTENPEKYGLRLRPARGYDFVYADEDFIRRSAYIFEPIDEQELKLCWDVRKKGAAYQTVQMLVSNWVKERWRLQRLDMEDTGTGIDIYDMRKIARYTVYRLEGAQAAVYRARRTARQESWLLSELSGSYGNDEIADSLARLCEENLMVHIGSEYLALAVDINAKKVGV